jgi:bifunctional UDP-N-acetylglucosamine pyrophosphorylase/glucosamine-1-phosphate N-acetyltransferase
VPLHIVLLAAGKGTRMRSAVPKVLHRVAGAPLVEHVLTTAASQSPDSLVVVLGHEAEVVRAALSHRQGLTFVVQEPQRGTGDALLTTAPALERQHGTLLLLSGDVPLLRAETLTKLIAHHDATGSSATVVTALVEDPRGYGRVLRDGQRIARIVEERDASPEERTVREINSGIYAFALDGLFDAVREIASVNAQGEYYLPDLVPILLARGRTVETLRVDDPDEVRGINSRAELEAVSHIIRRQKNESLMMAGVTIEDSATTYIDGDVLVGADTVIHPNVSLQGTTSIGAGCDIHSGVRIVDSQIGDGVTILDHCVITDSVLEQGARVGPFAHLRPGATLRERARVGNFVELKKTVLGAGSKSMHLAYLGDATIGQNVNVGAGTITCNYDGEKKHPTIIEDGAFIGTDSQLVAPVQIGKGAYVGSGTTVRENVPAGALAVSAGKQRNIDGWTQKRKKKF